MRDRKEKKTADIIKKLEDRNHYVEQFKNGQIKVNGWDFWCTSEKFWNGQKGIKGQGLHNFLKHIEDD